MVFFNDWLCVINVHHDHNNRDKIARIFEKIKIESPACYQKLLKYQIILGGDINHNLKKQNLHITDSKYLTGITSSNPINKNKITCCNTFNGLYGNYQYYNYRFWNTNDTYDHILISNDGLIEEEMYQGGIIVDPEYKISDHAPVYSRLNVKRYF